MSNSEFTFDVEGQLMAYCREITQEMMSEFNISYDEALGRINKHWGGQEFDCSDEIIYHETTEYWAKRIYYKSSCNWWVKGAKLEAKPYP
jgi:hypothetical protein